MGDNTKNNYVDELSALLDFYSDRCTSHASFFIATIFGMFALLSIQASICNNGISSIQSVYLAFTYWLLVVAGIYFLSSFKYYSDYSELINQMIIYFPKEYEDFRKEIKISAFSDLYAYITHRVAIKWASNWLFYHIIYRIRSGIKPHEEDERLWKTVIRYLINNNSQDKRFGRLFVFVITYFVIAYLTFVTVFNNLFKQITDFIPYLSVVTSFFMEHGFPKEITVLFIIIGCSTLFKFLFYRSLEKRSSMQ